jgi:5-methylcytosine-specific restriction endonuclease McrBC regulatory subunit McrC
VLRDYRQEEDDRRALRGRLMIECQFTRFAGRLDLFGCRFDEFSPNIQLNRILAVAP